MKAATTAIGLLLAVGSLGMVAVARWQSALPSEGHRTMPVPPIRLPPDSLINDSLAIAEESIASNDPFRVANSPPAVRYDPTSEAARPNDAAPLILVRPSFALRAIVGGPPWQAVIDGIPGQPSGTIVRAGMIFDKLTVSAITRDSVIIKGPDTTWALSFHGRP